MLTALINAFVPFSAKNATGRDIMEGNEDGFGILRNASASQLFHSPVTKGLQPGVMCHSVTGEKEGVCRFTYMKRKIQSGLEGIDTQHLPESM